MFPVPYCKTSGNLPPPPDLLSPGPEVQAAGEICRKRERGRLVDAEGAIGAVAHFGHFGHFGRGAGNKVCIMNKYFYIPI